MMRFFFFLEISYIIRYRDNGILYGLYRRYIIPNQTSVYYTMFCSSWKLYHLI